VHNQLEGLHELRRNQRRSPSSSALL
jgi:hypothetical protein